jgi:hypothetical protein
MNSQFSYSVISIFMAEALGIKAIGGGVTFNNRVHRATLLAEAAVDTFCHINIISRCSPAPILTFLCLNCNGLSWTDGFAQLACNAAFLAGGVASESMFAAETR